MGDVLDRRTAKTTPSLRISKYIHMFRIWAMCPGITRDERLTEFRELKSRLGGGFEA